VKRALPLSRAAMPEPELRVPLASPAALASAEREKRDGNLPASLAVEQREQVSVTCFECGRRVVGIVYVSGRYRTYRCSNCVPLKVRERPPSQCEGCHRLLVQVWRDERFCHVVCSPECQRDVRRKLRHAHSEPRRCFGCGEMFTPNRRDARTCSDRCRMRAFRDRRRRAAA
jgi:hypothetical protein